MHALEDRVLGPRQGQGREPEGHDEPIGSLAARPPGRRGDHADRRTAGGEQVDRGRDERRAAQKWHPSSLTARGRRVPGPKSSSATLARSTIAEGTERGSM